MTACTPTTTTISALPEVINLALYAGDDFRLNLAVNDSYGQPVDLTGYTATASIRTTRTDAVTLADFAATIEANVVHLHLAGADSATLTTPAVWDVQLAGPDITTLATGNVATLAEVTRP